MYDNSSRSHCRRRSGFYPTNLRANARQLFLDRLVTAIEMVDPQHLGGAFSDKAREHEARRSAQVGCHHRRAGQLVATAHDRNATADLNISAHPAKLGNMHEAV